MSILDRLTLGAIKFILEFILIILAIFCCIKYLIFR